jgi:hypothetical protein
MTDEEQEKYRQLILEKHCNALAEHFDVVQILVSGVNDEGNTYRQFYGSGNYFARTGMCHDFVGQEAATQIANKLDPPEE